MKLVIAAAAVLLLVACGQAADSASPVSPADDGTLTLRLGFFPNLTHAPALAGVKKGFFAATLGSNVTLETHTFNAGGDAITAILSNSIDATFVGPNPTTNAFIKSHGQAIRVIAGSTSGGALLVVKGSVTSIAALKGRKIADPQLGGTQDVALRWFLQSKGFKTDTAGGGDVSILPQDNSQTLTAFRQGKIDGAWVPEPWASRLVVEGGGTVLVDERDLWPQGQFDTTNLIVSTTFLHSHPKRIKALLEGLYESVAYLNADTADAQKLTNDAVAEITGSRLAAGVVSAAWAHMTFTLDPLATTLKVSADHSRSVGLLGSVDLHGMYDLTLVNQVLAEHGLPGVRGI
ncbi:MAG TPA: ABC transporter substrate-binding protein [Candidatus Dormibacteraeota bacterium]|nr:ABC transporter substrate-binding protein [Candidatus Dormibacteraeota bacterium]